MSTYSRLIINTLILQLLLLSNALPQINSGTGIYNDTLAQIPLSQQPELIRSGLCPYPPDLLKKGIEGRVLLDIYIDDKGRVEEVEVIQGAYPTLDSIARQSAFQFLFSPAKQEDRPIPVVIRFQYTFDLSNILHNIECSPNFIGSVIDAETEKPFRNFPVVCDFIDTASDTALSISFERYIRLISLVKGHYYIDGKLITRTDSLGYFQFFLLPACSLKVRVNPLSHKMLIAKEVIKPGEFTRSVYKLTAFTDAVMESGYEITVYGKKSTHERINVVEEELRYGLTDDINKILFVRSAANQIPERGSSIIIHGGGIYDNTYFVSDIPVFPPSHFTNYPTLDISGTMVSTLENVSIISSRTGGRYANAPGCVISMQPGIYRPAKKKWLTRPELVANVSTRRMDFSLSTPLRKNKDFYQIAYAFANKGFIKSWQGGYTYSEFGLAPPKYYGDLTLTGRSNFNHLNINSFFWLAFDKYKSLYYNYDKHELIPWGIGSVAFEVPGKNSSTVHRAVIGGSAQSYYEGKSMGLTSPLKVVTRENATVLLESQSISFGPFLFDYKERLEYLRWHGAIYARDFSASGYGTRLLTRGDDEIHLKSHLGIQYKNDLLSVGSDLLIGTIMQYKNFFFDPGLWCSISHNGGSIGFSAGIVSSYPDIRGLPDKSYRRKINKTYMATSLLEHRFFKQTTKISLEPYVRLRDHCPCISYDFRLPVWDDSLATPLYTSGVNCRLLSEFIDICDIELAGTVGKSYRMVNNRRKEYEWDIPWSVKSFFRFYLGERQMHLSLNSIVSPGIPYRDIADNNKLKQSKIYIRPDIHFQYHSRNIVHRYFTRYDLYLGIMNFSNLKNYVEPYWDSFMNEQWIRLTPFMIYLGGRFAFRI